MASASSKRWTFQELWAIYVIKFNDVLGRFEVVVITNILQIAIRVVCVIFRKIQIAKVIQLSKYRFIVVLLWLVPVWLKINFGFRPLWILVYLSIPKKKLQYQLWLKYCKSCKTIKVNVNTHRKHSFPIITSL